MKDDILRLTQEFIAIPSVSGKREDSVQVLEHAKKQLQGFAFTPFVSNHHPSLLFTNRTVDNRKFTLILNAHLDVVPGNEAQFKPHIKDGKLYGRGAYDMKGAASVMVLLFKELAHKVSYPLGLQLTTDEESHGDYGTGYQMEQGVYADFAITGESSSNFRVTNEAKGRSVIKLTVKGTTAHSAYAWLGKNALVRMYEVLGPIIKAYPEPAKETFETTVAITSIETPNDATNKIPGVCHAYLDVRYPDKDKDTFVSAIKSLLPDDVIMEIIPKHPPLYVPPTSKYITMLNQSVAEVIGESLPLRFAHGTSDAPYFTLAGGEGIEFGPIGGGDHRDEEWVDIQSLYDYYTMLKHFLHAIDAIQKDIAGSTTALGTVTASQGAQLFKEIEE